MTRRNDKVAQDAALIVVRLQTGGARLTDLMDEYRCAYPTIMRAILSRMSAAEWKDLTRRNLARRGIATRLRQGHVPWTKGVKGIHLSPATEFKAGHIRGNAARLYRPIGSIVIRQGKKLSQYKNARHGPSSRWIKIKDDDRPQDRYIPYARYLWEKVNGRPVPPGHLVGHQDNNTMNDAPGNLIPVNRQQHMRRLYERPGVIAKCRAKAAAATKKRHAQNRQAKRWAKARRRQRVTVWDCRGCGADFRERPDHCPKCGSTALVGRDMESMPDSMSAETAQSGMGS